MSISTSILTDFKCDGFVNFDKMCRGIMCKECDLHKIMLNFKLCVDNAGCACYNYKG